MNHTNLLQCPPAGLFKQLIAMLYDSLLIAALLFFATSILMLLNFWLFEDGSTIEGPIFRFYLLMIVFIFYAGFWNKGGQTLGMKAWKIRIINEYGYNPSWATGFIRLAFALLSIGALGFGYWWRLFTPYTWHDRFSHTKVIDVSSLPVESD